MVESEDTICMTITVVYPGRSETLTVEQFLQKFDGEKLELLCGATVLHAPQYERMKERYQNEALLLILNLPDGKN